jgi:hypothetical protein
MSGFAAEVELLGLLVRANASARRPLTAAECDLILDVCTEIIAMAHALPGGHPGRAARAGTGLLLELTVPTVDAEVRHELARAVEVIAVRKDRPA